MKKQLLACGFLGVACVAIALQARVRGGAVARAALPAAEDAEVRGLVLAAPFVLDVPWTHAWRAGEPSFRAGWLLVLDVDPKLVRPTDLAQPVLSAGVETLERINQGFESGRVIAVLPSTLDAQGLPAADLAGLTFYFASPELPESMTIATLERELGAARARNLQPFDGAVIAAALQRGGGLIATHDRVELDRLAAALILEFSPADHECAEALLVPVTR